MAAVNNWDDAIKLRWLKARLTGRAQVTMQRLSKAEIILLSLPLLQACLRAESPRLCMADTQTTTDINAQGLLTTLLQRMGKLQDTLAEARMHMGFGKKRNDVQEGHAHSATPVLPINSSSAYKIPAFINNIRVNLLLDTGAAVSLIRRDVYLWEQVNAKKQQQRSPIGHQLVGVDGTPLKILGTARVGIRIGQELFSANLIILEFLTTVAIFELDFLQANQCIIDTHSKQIQFADRNMKLPLSVDLNEAATHVTLDNITSTTQ